MNTDTLGTRYIRTPQNGKKMNSRTAYQNGRRLAPLLLIPVLLVLAGCFKLDMNVDIRAEDDATLTLELFDKTGALDMEDLGCEDIQDDLGNGTAESIEDSEGNTGRSEERRVGKECKLRW